MHGSISIKISWTQTDTVGRTRPTAWGSTPICSFPERGASTREAKEVCRGCVVRLDCLEYALGQR